jgi:hypothetical protein
MKYSFVPFIVGLGLLLVGVAPAADSLNVRFIGSYDTPYNAVDVAVKGDYAFVADQSSGLRVISIADPAHPTEVGSSPAYATVVTVRDSYAYVAGASSGLLVVSVADPTHPTRVSTPAVSRSTPGMWQWSVAMPM